MAFSAIQNRERIWIQEMSDTIKYLKDSNQSSSSNKERTEIWIHTTDKPDSLSFCEAYINEERIIRLRPVPFEELHRAYDDEWYWNYRKSMVDGYHAIHSDAMAIFMLYNSPDLYSSLGTFIKKTKDQYYDNDYNDPILMEYRTSANGFRDSTTITSFKIRSYKYLKGLSKSPKRFIRAINEKTFYHKLYDKYDSVKPDGSGDGFYIYSSNMKGYINPVAEIELPPVNEDLRIFKGGHTIIATRNGFEGLLNKKGEVTLPFMYEKLSLYPGNFIIAKLETKYGILSYLGETIVPVEYDSIELERTGSANLTKGENSTTINLLEVLESFYSDQNK